jgi:two-component system, response regulator PdtaR
MPHTRTPKILIVDDDLVLLDSYRRQLRDAGYAVAPAARIDTALCLAEAWRPDVAIIDIQLGHESGLDLLRGMLERQSLRTILLASDAGSFDDFSTWLADAVLLKSADLSEAIEKVHDLLSSEAIDASM